MAAEEKSPILQSMGTSVDAELAEMLDTPAYRVLLNSSLMTTRYRKKNFEDIFVGVDLAANSSKDNDVAQKCMSGYFIPVLGCIIYHISHTELFVPAGHVGLLLDEKRQYIFAQPGMHNIASLWVKHVGTQALPKNGVLMHGNRSILVVEQGYIALGFDNGQPILFPPGIHVWTSETLRYHNAIALDQHVIALGPYTLLTVDEGYAAITQNNGKQQILSGGHTHLLDHKNWRMEKFITLKIQTDDLQDIMATSADNITMKVTSTVTWRVVDAMLAATMGADTMAVSETRSVTSDITKIRADVLKQALASLASFIGGVNYSDSFALAAKAQSGPGRASRSGPEPGPSSADTNPLYDSVRMGSAVDHANQMTMTYGVEILHINILVAVPTDRELTKALASGAVASAEALQSETAARGNAKAMKIDADANALKSRIDAEGEAGADIIRAKGEAQTAKLRAEGDKKAAEMLSTSRVAVELAKMDKSALMMGKASKMFFGQEPGYFSSLMMKK